MADKFYKYRPLLDLIGTTEGTDRGQCYRHVCAYDVTLGYGAYTDGPVDLTAMSLAQVDDLQTKMLKHPNNKWNSSACGRYQIVRTTLRALKKQMGLSDSTLYNEATQDALAVQLLKNRGVDKYLKGAYTEDSLINSLAKEWASLPKTNDRGHYGGQHAAVKAQAVRDVLMVVKARNLKPLKKSRTIGGAAGAGTGTAGAVVAEKNIPEETPAGPDVGEIGETLQETSQGLFGLAEYSEIIMYLFLALTVVSLGLIVYARIDDRKKERR